MRPLREDHPSFDGSNPLARVHGTSQLRERARRQRSPLVNSNAEEITFPAWEVVGPWDVDNDGDGVDDSVWVDIGLPVQQTEDGRFYKPLVAMLVEDLDGPLEPQRARVRRTPGAQEDLDPSQRHRPQRATGTPISPRTTSTRDRSSPATSCSPGSRLGTGRHLAAAAALADASGRRGGGSDPQRRDGVRRRRSSTTTTPACCAAAPTPTTPRRRHATVNAACSRSRSTWGQVRQLDPRPAVRRARQTTHSTIRPNPSSS